MASTFALVMHSGKPLGRIGWPSQRPSHATLSPVTGGTTHATRSASRQPPAASSAMHVPWQSPSHGSGSKCGNAHLPVHVPSHTPAQRPSAEKPEQAPLHVP
jgi:hypothetical protein